jgi:hypothetical protein
MPNTQRTDTYTAHYTNNQLQLVTDGAGRLISINYLADYNTPGGVGHLYTLPTDKAGAGCLIDMQRVNEFVRNGARAVANGAPGENKPNRVTFEASANMLPKFCMPRTR